MTTKVLDVFSLRDAVVGDYKRFATSFTTIHADDIRQQVEAIYARERYWPEPLIQINPSYRRSTTIDRLAASGTLNPRCAEIFRTPPTANAANGEPLSLYKHQEQAIALASHGESYVVTTGTGSGKSLCFFIPIVNAVLQEKRADATPRTRAIVIYPMNALANSQLEELDKFISHVRGAKPVTFDRYTGQDDAETRRRISENPPDILLTNFMMLELLMTRQDEIDRRVIGNCAGLQFLVLDELHTYRGRQGADVALLVRRVRERLAPERLQCVGTSATMASEGSLEDKSRVVARVASKLFSIDIPESNVIVETLDRVTDATLDKNLRSVLGAAIDTGLRQSVTDAELRVHPLAVWVEARLGVSFSDVDQRWVRARPLTVTEAVDALSKEAGRDPAACLAALRELLLISSVPETQRTSAPQASPQSFFAFKLHQFISGAGHAFATLDSPGRRVVTVEGQQFLPGDPEKRLYAVHFCRDCGHEYHPVRLVTEGGSRMFLARDIDDAAPSSPDEDETTDEAPDESADQEVFGFLTLHAPDRDFTFDDRDEDYPENWLDYDAAGNPRLKPHYRATRARSFTVAPTGKVGSGARAWFLKGKFRFCLRCGATQGGAARDRNRLASLSAEGRSSATTVLVSSALRWMHGLDSGLDTYTRKLLGFTDNRQDAALQSGHFNDFLFVSLVRAGFLGALDVGGQAGIRSDALGGAQQKSLGFERATPEVRAEWLLEPTLRGFNLQEAEGTLRQVLAYRVWFDQRRGWRFTNPNLEQLELVTVDYLGLDDLAADGALFAGAPLVFRHASATVRAAVYQEILDHLRKWMAIRSQVLDPMVIEQMVAKSHSRIRAPWGFGTDEKPRPARWLMVAPPSRRDTTLRDQDLIVRGGSRSALGKTLRASKLWNGSNAIRDLTSKEFDALVEVLLRAAATLDLATCTTPSGAPCQAPNVRPDNAPICPVVSDAGDLAFVTLRGGGLLVVDPKASPMRIVAEYDMKTVKGNGCGGVQVGDQMYVNSGGRPGVMDHLGVYGFDVYRFRLESFNAARPSTAPNAPAPMVVFSADGQHDSHGMVATGGGAYVWVADRHADVIEVIATADNARVGTIALNGTLTTNAAPDLMDISPSGTRAFVAFRGPTPLSGDPHNATGSTPGLGVIEVGPSGRDGTVVGLIRLTNRGSDGVERADPHAVRVRPLN